MTSIRTPPAALTALEQHPLPRTAPTTVPTSGTKPARLVSLDAYRGAIMLFMASGGLALPTVAKHFPNSPLWRFLAFNTDHVEWVGCSLWDLIQPSFMFMVGVALPYSIASRRAKGDSEPKIFVHILTRAVFLVLLAIFLTSNWSKQTDFVFTNVLAQIGLGYPFLYPLLGRGRRVQATALASILLGYWLLFLLWPLPSADPAGSPPAVPSWFAHWGMNTNAASAFDMWFLNLFPRVEPFVVNKGGYQTLNFIPSLGTMILGLMAGEILRQPLDNASKLARLLAASALCLALGWVAGEILCPIVKRIWTPSWVLYSGGWTFALLAGFFWPIDMRGLRCWAFPLIVVGMNSIAMYCMAQLMKGWIRSSLQIHLGPFALPALRRMPLSVDPAWLNDTFGPLVQSAAVLLILWLICLWMYRRGLFLRL
jgi:heparan-alpha-glucosaminide N-acetyltransferase